MTTVHIGEPARVAAEMGLEFSLTDNGDLVLHGGSRDVRIRRIVCYQVDDLRFLDPDDAINAAIALVTDFEEPQP